MQSENMLEFKSEIFQLGIVGFAHFSTYIEP